MKILITGGNRGIGRAIAERMLSDGHGVLIVASSASSFAKVPESLAERNPHLSSLACDLRDPEAVRNLAERVEGQGFAPDVLVLNAGCFFEENLQEATPDHISAQIQVNLVSQIQLIQGFAECLKRSSRARIIIIGSTSAFEAYAYGPIYSITKWALRGLAENARAEFRSARVGVTLIHPGGTWTDLWEGAELPRNRLMEPSDIAAMVAATLSLSDQAIVDELVIRPIEGDFHE